QAGGPRRHHAPARRLEDLDRRDGAEGAGGGREARRHRHAHAPRAREERRPGDGAHREAPDRAGQDRAAAAGGAAVRLAWLIAAALAAGVAGAQEKKKPAAKKSPPAKVPAAHKKATPEQIRKFNELEKKQQR